MAESYSTAVSLYRKWRSQDFAEVVGQEHVTQTLRNAVRYHTAGHAYLFTGPRGTGKTSTARILARAVNCLDPRDGEPCNHCAPCQSMLANRCLDLVEIDAASNNSVDNVRDLREKVSFAPTEVRRKVYIVDEVHMLSTSAFNALLKTLEEPPAHVLFVLATTDVHKVPATITSRCQRLDFRTISPRDIAGRLAYVCAQEGIHADPAALDLVAQQATGSLRDALSLLEQVRAYETARIGLADVEEALGLARRDTLAGLTDAIVAGDAGAALTLIGELAAAGTDMRQYAKQLVQYWRDLLLLCAGGAGRERDGQARDARMVAQAGRIAVGDVTAILKAILQPDYSGRRGASAQWQLELAVVEASQHFAVGSAPGTVGSAPAAPRIVRGPAVAEDAHPRAATALEPASGAAATSSAQEPARVSGHEPAQRPAAPGGNGRGDLAPRTEAQPTTAAVTPPATAPAHEERSAAPPEQGASAEPPAWGTAAARAAESAAPVPAPGAAPPVADVEQVWRQVRQVLAATGKPRLNAILNDYCRPTRIDDTGFVLGFIPTHRWYREQVEKAANRQAIEEALSQVLGRPIGLRCDTISPSSLAVGAPTMVEQTDPFIDDAARHLRAIHTDSTPR